MARPFKEAFTTMRRTPYQAVGAILVLFITFFVAYAFSFLLYGSEIVIRYFETRPQVTAFFKQDTKDQQVQAIQEDMQAKPYVAKVKVITKTEALSLYKQESKQDPLMLELVTADILPASIEVSGKDIQSLEHIEQDLQQYSESIDEIVYQKSMVDSLARWTRALRMIGIGVVGIMALTSVVVMVIIISMKVAMKKNEIAIMRLLGATSWYIHAPFVIEAIMYGFFGSMLAWGTVVLGLLYSTPWIIDFFGEIPVFPVPWQMYALQLAVGVGISALLGVISTSLALKRFTK